MVEFKWAMLCHRACVDKYSNLLSILDVTDEISIGGLPDPLPENALLPVSLQMISMWHRSDRERPEQFWAKFTIEMPDGEEYVPETILEGDLRTHLRFRMLFGVQAIPFKGAGVYVFNVLASEKPDGPFEMIERVPLEIKLDLEAASPAGAPGPLGEPTPSAPPKSSSPRVSSRPSRRPTSPKQQRRGSS